MSDTPTTKEELERKSVEFLEVMVNRHDRGELTDRELGLVGHAVWSIACGLVDESVAELAAKVSDTRNTGTLKRHFAGKGQLYSAIWNPVKPGYVLVKRDAINPSTHSVVKASKAEVGEREQELHTLFSALRTGGYVEI